MENRQAQLATARPAPPPVSIRTPTERYLGIGVVAALHIALAFALINAMSIVSLPRAVHVLEVLNIAPEQPKTTPPPPPAIEPPKPVVVAPEVVIDIPKDEAPTTAIAVPPLEPATPPAPAAPPAPPPQVADRDAMPVLGTHTIPAYPALSRRLGETGTVGLKLTISPEGAVVDAKVGQTSGSARLDEAAEEWVKEHWRYKPAIKDGMPVTAIADANVVFRLT